MKNNEISYWFTQYTGWILIWVLCLIPTVIFFFLHPIGREYTEWYSIFANIGRLTGILGFVLYAINLVLTIKTNWLESLFGGLNRVYIAHHITGGLSLALLLFHPLFLAIRYIELQMLNTLQYAANELIPHAIDLTRGWAGAQESVMFNAGIIAFVGMVILLILTFFIKLPYHIWLFTHKFLGVAFLFAGLHVLFISSDVNDTPLLFWYMATLTLVGFTSFVYKTVLGNILIKQAPYRLDSVSIVPTNTVQVELTALDKPIQFKPGQYVFVKFIWDEKLGISDESHPFSVASSPNEPTLRLYMKALGDYTSKLHLLQPGTIAEVEGAFGRFGYTNNKSPQIWIGGGIGVTPFLSMARSFKADSPEVNMLYVVGKREELVDQYALSQYIPTYYPQFKYNYYIGAENQGHINAEYVQAQVGSLEGKEIFICGPTPMMQQLREQFRKLGIHNSKIHTEEFTM